MLFPAERRMVIETIADLRADGNLDKTGGAISVRVDDDKILMTPAGASLRRWKVSAEELVILSAGGDIIEGGAYCAAASLPLSMTLFAQLKHANAIVHAHAPWSLIFACADLETPNTINSTAALGDMPLLGRDAWEVVAWARANPDAVSVPGGMVSRVDVAAVNRSIADEALRHFLPREEELTRHSLVATLASHGVVVISNSLQQAVDHLTKVEASARVGWHLAVLGTKPSAVDVGTANHTIPAQVFA